MNRQFDIKSGSFWMAAWPVIPALLLFGLIAGDLNFTQDDAYITYRYVANYLDGHGLVYNIGEQIEGFTNFGWTVLLSAIGGVGGDYIFWSKVLGFLCGAGVIVLCFMLGRLVFGDQKRWAVLLGVYLVAINQSLAYWSPAGLETAAFSFLGLLALYLFLKRSWMLVVALVLAVWIRPEGAMVTGLLIIIEAITRRRVPRFTLAAAGIAFVASLPFVAFKIYYYGSILPNPFYAKTGFSIEQIASGAEYASRFFMHYGFYGLGFIVPLLFWRKLSESQKSIWLFAAFYTAYIVLVGGDVLKVHRFFLPVMVPAALLMALSVETLIDNLKGQIQTSVFVGVGVVLVALTWVLPGDFVRTYNEREKKFTSLMQLQAQHMKASDNSTFSVALPTIGIFGYELLGHDIIDMVGLTDSTIARHPEPEVVGMETTWRESRHNSRYLLERQPDYVLFSTGIKPSAPAERALLLYKPFMDAYRAVGWYFGAPGQPRGSIRPAFKRVRDVQGELVPTYPVEYVQLYKQGMDYYSVGEYRKAIAEFDNALRASPKPYYPYLVYQKASAHMLSGDHDQAQRILDILVSSDSLIFEGHKDLYFYAVMSDNAEKAAIHERWLKELVPWYWPRVQQQTAEQYRQAMDRAGQKR